MTAPAELLIATLEYYGGETRTGYGRSIRCPFHGDRHRSAVMTTTDDGGLFYCHTCGIGGDAYALIMWHEGIDFNAAVTRATDIAARAGIQLPQQDGQADRGVFGQPRVHKRTRTKTSTWNRTRRL